MTAGKANELGHGTGRQQPRGQPDLRELGRTMEVAHPLQFTEPLNGTLWAVTLSRSVAPLRVAVLESEAHGIHESMTARATTVAMGGISIDLAHGNGGGRDRH